MECDICLDRPASLKLVDPPILLCDPCAEATSMKTDRLTPLLTPKAPPPEIAGVSIPAPDPADLPGPESNILRVFQWPPHCGQWFARIGAPNDRRSIQYGPLRSAAEVLESLARHLAARGYRFDGGYEPPE